MVPVETRLSRKLVVIVVVVVRVLGRCGRRGRSGGEDRGLDDILQAGWEKVVGGYNRTRVFQARR